MADNILFANNASALLAASISDTDTTIQVASGFGANFPSPTGSQYFLLALVDNLGNIEVVKITGRTGDNLTMDSVADRAQDGTTAQSFTLTVTRCELRLTKATAEEFLQKNGGVMTGDLDLNGNGVVDAVLSGALTQITAGEIVNVPIRNATGVTTNQIAVPASPGRATVGGASILAVGDDIVAELDTAGVIILDSATVGVRILDTAYLRVEGNDPSDYIQIDMDDTDVNFTFAGVTDVDWSGAPLNMLADLKMNENDLTGPLFSDYSMKENAVNSSASTTINYLNGSYVDMTHDANITSLSVSNLPSTGVAFLRLKMVKSVGGETCDFSSLGTTVRAPSGQAPTMSAGAGDIDVVDIWTEDGGTNWFVVGQADWSAI